MAKVGSLLIDLAMNTARLQADAGKAAQSINRMERNFKRSMSGIERQVSSVARSIRGFAGTLGIAAGAGGLALMTKNSIDAADKIGKLSQRLGISTEALSEYRHVAELSGVTFETLTMGFQRMTRRISEAANGTGEAREAIRELGLVAGALNKLAPDEQFEAIARAMEGVTKESDRVRLAMKLFDSEGVALVQTMTNGEKGIRDMRAQAQQLGVSMSKDVTDKAARANDAITRVNATMRGLGLETIPMVTPLIEGFAALFSEVVNPVMNKVNQVLHGINAGTAFLGAGLAQLFGFESDADKLFARFESAMDQIQALKDEADGIQPIKVFGGMEDMDMQVAAYQEALQGMALAMVDTENQMTNAVRQSTAERIAEAQFEANTVRNLKQSVATGAIGLLQTLGQKNKGFARAAIVLQKAMAIAQINLERAKSLAAARTWSYIFGPAADAKFAAAAAQINALSNANIGIVAATGLAELSNVNSGAGTSTGGVAASSNTVSTVGGATQGTSTSGQQTTIILQGDVYGFDDFREKVTEAVRAATDSDTIIIGRNTRQALEFA